MFVLSAPSGAGKTTLVDALRQTSEFIYSISCTTRPARAGEVEGEDYRFLSEEEFDARARSGEFLEYAIVHGHQYGTLLKPIVDNLMSGRDVLIDIDTQGAANIRNSKDEFVRQALADIFIMPPDVDELRRRLTKRGTASYQRDPRNAILAEISLHYHQSDDGRGSGEISTHHECRAIFEPAIDPKVIAGLDETKLRQTN